MGWQGLAGKVAIVTGAGQGIGAATARRLIDEGCHVVGADADADRLGDLSEALNSPAFLPARADAASERGCETYIAAALRHFGAVDLLLNNVDISGPALPIGETSLADFEHLVAVNLRSVFLGLRAGVQQMRLQGRGGVIVNVASMAAVSAAPGRRLYGASRQAIIGLADAAALENDLASIRISTVLPGPVDTPLSKFDQEYRTKMVGGSSSADAPPVRKARPEDIAAFVVWLFSDEASYLTGSVHSIDGAASL